MLQIFIRRCNVIFSPLPPSFWLFSTPAEGPIGHSLKPKSRNCDSDWGEGVGVTRASAGCEVVVDWADRRESFFLEFALFIWISASLTHAVAAASCITSFFLSGDGGLDEFETMSSHIRVCTRNDTEQKWRKECKVEEKRHKSDKCVSVHKNIHNIPSISFPFFTYPQNKFNSFFLFFIENGTVKFYTYNYITLPNL